MRSKEHYNGGNNSFQGTLGKPWDLVSEEEHSNWQRLYFGCEYEVRNLMTKGLRMRRNMVFLDTEKSPLGCLGHQTWIMMLKKKQRKEPR